MAVKGLNQFLCFDQPRNKIFRLLNDHFRNKIFRLPNDPQLCDLRCIDLSLSPGDDEDTEFDRSAEISEIDERLDRLQQLMKASMP